MNVTSDSNCKLPDDGDFTDGKGNPKGPIQDFPCARPKAPPNAVVKINRDMYRVTCAKTLTVRFGPNAEPTISNSNNYTQGNEITMKGEYMELECHEPEKSCTRLIEGIDPNVVDWGWVEIVLRVDSKANLINTTKTNKDALNIAVIFLDSISRAEVMHYTPHTTRLLKSLHRGNGKHQSFVFNRFQTTGGGTVQNLAPFFCGRSALDESHATMVENGNRFTACGNKFIWNYLAGHGYVSAYGSSDNNVMTSMDWPTHTITDTGHLVPEYASSCLTGWGNPLYDPIYCNKSTLTLCDNSKFPFVVCCGSSHIGEYNVKYMSDFHSDEVYPTAGKFSMISLDTAHESGAFASAEDMSMYNFISELTKRDDTVVYIMSDHGNGNEGTRLPMSTLVVPTQFLNKHPAAQRALEVYA